MFVCNLNGNIKLVAFVRISLQFYQRPTSLGVPGREAVKTQKA
jgi:hypothetical protein